MTAITTENRRRIGCMTVDEDNEGFAVRFPYNEGLVSSIRAVAGAAWDKEDRCWTVPLDSRDALEMMITELRPTLEDVESTRQAEYARLREEAKSELKADPIEKASTKNVQLAMTEDGSRIVVKFSYAEKAVALLKEVRGARWDKEAKSWTVPADQHKELRERVASISRSVGQAAGKTGAKRKGED